MKSVEILDFGDVSLTLPPDDEIPIERVKYYPDYSDFPVSKFTDYENVLYSYSSD